MSIYFNNPWKPIKHTLLKDTSLADTIHEKGYAIVQMLNEQQLSQLRNSYDSLHDIADERGGMFYSVYSRDLPYRKKVFQELESVLGSIYQEHFVDYKTILHSFVIKASGPESEFYLHQDTTGVDESKFSALNVWMPLHDVDETNGCLALVEKSHKFFSPYRSISFPAPFDPIQNTVRKYLKPIPMKAGEVIIFDNRILHNSLTNLSGKTRIAAVSGLLPKAASIVTCHKANYELEGLFTVTICPEPQISVAP